MSPLGIPFFRKASTDSQNSASSADTASTTSLIARPQLAGLTSPSQTTINTTTGTIESIPYSGRISPSAAAAVGWGKVVADGGYLSVHTLGTVGGKQLDVATNLIRTDTTQRLTELRNLMKSEPEPLDY